jgi:tRNA1(Val) A37 N6-methylase TrmN6
MSLLFQRTAHNFVKNGYFPTDTETLSRILKALQPADSGTLCILDPCCGEGNALIACQNYLGTTRTQSFGIELDEERVGHAKEQLNQVLQADFMDCIVTPQSMGLLFLNPPYGDLATDPTHYLKKGGRKRLEKAFYQRSIHLLQPNGVLVLIIPYSTLDQELTTWITKHCRDVRMYIAPEQQYRQLVILGIRGAEPTADAAVPLMLNAIKQGKLPPELPAEWALPSYRVPSSKTLPQRFATTRIDAKQLDEVVKQSPCLWEQFTLRFGQQGRPIKRPLLDLSRWHLALTLAAGQVTGLVKAHDGRCLLVKGDTFKTQVERTTYTEQEDGSLLEIRISQDQFVPVIRAIDVTNNSATFGNVITIR